MHPEVKLIYQQFLLLLQLFWLFAWEGLKYMCFPGYRHNQRAILMAEFEYDRLMHLLVWSGHEEDTQD